MTDSASHPSQTLLAQAGAAFDQGNPREAFALATQLLRTQPRYPEAHYLAGVSAMALNQMSQALEHLHQAASLQPRHPDYAIQFACALARVQRTSEALQVANIAISLAPSDPHMLDVLGTVYFKCHAHERAASVFRRAVELAPENASFHFNLATSLIFFGELDHAASELALCLSLAPNYWAAYSVRSRLRRQTRAANHIDELQALVLRTGDDLTAQLHLHMALAKEYEDLNEFAEAFNHLVAGKSANRSGRNYSAKSDEAIVGALLRAFPTPQPQPVGCLTDEPIFIIGMPRSGTTLVERILSSHPEVYAAGELQNFGLLLEQLTGGRSPVMLDAGVIERARHINWQQLGDAYLSSTRPATSLKPRFIDKLPHNFLYAGHIANALPHARIICLRRNPLDTCLSNFREPFGETSPFHGYSFDLLDIGRYYILFDRLMAHWKRVLPGRILEVDYDALVVEQEGGTRKLLEYCDLPWNEGCLHFERNTAPSTTASAMQVRAPIHQGALKRWTKYESQVKGLRDLLETAGIDCDP